MMDATEQAERLHHVSLWEQGVSPDDESANLHLIMGEYLFRLRRWLDGDYGVQFSRHNLEVFKGVNLSTLITTICSLCSPWILRLSTTIMTLSGSGTSRINLFRSRLIS
jgi:hypothetical protein